ncbi:hypothetical protein [Marinomonas atlantica]|nr:hypothetical protein [Marinomonas atlantica]MCO4785668.1 hypothetical protein [Marinomonas atlantica]
MKNLVAIMLAPTESQQKWSTFLFVGAILTIVAFGFMFDGYQDSTS